MLTFTPDGAAGLDVDVDASVTTLTDELVAEAGTTFPAITAVESSVASASAPILFPVVFIIV